MAKNKKWILIGTLLLISLCSFFVLAIKGNSRGRVENSVAALLENKLDLKYQITKKSIDDSMTDAGGEWAVKLDSNELNSRLTDMGIAVADDYDLKYFMDRLIEKSILVKGTDKYTLYRSELTLGGKTICETHPCNIYILRKGSGGEIYIGIYSN